MAKSKEKFNVWLFLYGIFAAYFIPYYIFQGADGNYIQLGFGVFFLISAFMFMIRLGTGQFCKDTKREAS